MARCSSRSATARTSTSSTTTRCAPRISTRCRARCCASPRPARASPTIPSGTATRTPTGPRCGRTALRNPYRFNLRPGYRRAVPRRRRLEHVGEGQRRAEGRQSRLAVLSRRTCVRPATSPSPRARRCTPRAATPCGRRSIAWDHGGASSAATGGAFYAGTAYPSTLQGAYFYADYGQNFIRTLKVDADNKLVPGSVAGFATGADAPVDIETGPDRTSTTCRSPRDSCAGSATRSAIPRRRPSPRPARRAAWCRWPSSSRARDGRSGRRSADL